MVRVAGFAVIVFELLLSASATAKGDSSLVGATISGGPLARPIEVEIDLPEDYGYLIPLDVPASDPSLPRMRANGGLAVPVNPPPVRQPRAGETPYVLVLHHDLSAYGLGVVDWAGRFDGRDMLFFPEPMIWGEKWEQYAGWYKADPLLAEQLRKAVAGALAAPSTGDGGLLP